MRVKFVALTTGQTMIIPREIMYLGRGVPRFYHDHDRTRRSNYFMSEKRSSPLFVSDTRTIPRSCYNSNEAKIGFTETGLTKEKAKEVASKLTPEERDYFLKAIEECKSEEDKAGYQRQLAAFRWCNKLGRPSKIPSLGEVDPTGTYCPVPEDWLMRKYDVVEHFEKCMTFSHENFITSFIPALIRHNEHDERDTRKTKSSHWVNNFREL